MAPRSEDPKLIIRILTFVLAQPITHCTSTSHTDRQTDRRTTYDSNTALAVRASSGNNYLVDVGDDGDNVVSFVIITMLFVVRSAVT